MMRSSERLSPNSRAEFSRCVSAGKRDAKATVPPVDGEVRRIWSDKRRSKKAAEKRQWPGPGSTRLGFTQHKASRAQERESYLQNGTYVENRMQLDCGQLLE